MSSLLKNALKAERERRKSAGISALVPLLKTLSAPQQAFIKDPSRFKLARCARRSGKSYCGVVYMLLEALSNPNTPILYIGLTRESAKLAVWDLLVTALDALRIPHEARPSALKITFPNGSSIRLFGADTPNAKNRLRGQKYKLVILDETGFFQAVDGLMPAILPTLADYAGTLAMLSSPGVILSGFFYDADVGVNKGSWTQHSWTLRDNPYFQKPANNPYYENRAEEELDTICRTLFNGDRGRPAFRREYLGEWVQDNTSLVYPFHEHNLYDEDPPLLAPMYAIGVDLGVSSASAIVVVKYSQYSREAHFVEVWKQKEVLIDDFAEVLKGFMEKYKTSLVVADTGGLGAAVVQELRKRYELPIKAAEKTDKSFYQRIFANDLLSGYIKAPRLSPLLDEWSKIVKDDTGEEVKGQENHCFTAGHLVLTSTGYKPIEEVQVGDLVLTHENRWMPVIKLWSREYSGDLLKISNPLGEDIYCTPNHKFWSTHSYRSGKGELTGQLQIKTPPRWVEARQLNKDKTYRNKDELTTPNIPTGSVTLTREECLMLGYWAAEGSISEASSQVSWAGHVDETRIVPLLERGLYRFGAGQIAKTRSTEKRVSVRGTGGKGRSLYFTSRDLVDLLKPLGAGTHKHLPGFFHCLNAEQAFWLLSGYIYGDGHFTKNGSIKTCSVSRQLTYQMSVICKLTGLLPSLRYQRRAGRWEGIGLSGKTKNDQWNLCISKREFYSRLVDYPELVEMFRDKRNFDIERTYTKVGRLSRTEGGINITQVLGISTVSNFTGTVYNLMVDEDASYTVNNITVSNCSDAALYIYRYIYQIYLKSYTKPETPEERMIRGLTERALKEKAELEDEAAYDY